MSVISENRLCYFCDKMFPHPSCFISNYHELWICYRCEDFTLPMPMHINYGNRENDECCVCFEKTYLIQLNCNHKVCSKCCKTIYFGSATKKRPVHWTEMSEERPVWPYKDNETDDNLKRDEHEYFEDTYFNYEENTCDQIIEIRNNLIPERPEWMNTEEFIHYENVCFRYHIKMTNAEKEWEEYNESKTKGDGICPLCIKIV